MIADLDHATWEGSVGAIAASTDGTRIVTASGAGGVRVWAVGRGGATLARKIDLPEHASAVARRRSDEYPQIVALALHPTRPWLAVSLYARHRASSETSVQVVDLESGLVKWRSSMG